MARNPSISISFSQNKFAQEVNKMATELKAVRKEFEISNLAIEATGNKTALAQNKLKGFAEEAKILRSATTAMQRGLDNAADTQAKLAARVEAAKKAYESAARSENKSAAEVEKLKKEYENLVQRLAKADKAVSNWQTKLQNAQINENRLKVAVSQTNKEIEEQNKKQLENIRNTQNVTTATGQLLNIYTLIKGLALGYAGKTLFEALIGSNAQFEQYMATFEVLLGSAEKAQKRMEELTEFAAKTPFEMTHVVEAEKRLLSYGVAAEDTAKMLQVLGDLSMGNAEKLGSLTLAYGQVVTATRLTGGELRQFAEAGIPLLDELAKMYNVTTAEMREMVSEGQISAEAVTVALQRMTSEGGKFYGMMDKQSQTMEGLLATLKDDIGMFARDVGEKSFGYLKGSLNDFMDQLEELEQSGQLGDIATEWGRNIGKFVEFNVSAIKALWDMKEALLAAGAAMVTYKAAMAVGTLIEQIVVSMRTLTAATKAADVANKSLNATLKVNPYVLLASVILSVVSAFVSYKLITKEAKTETDKLRDSIRDISEETKRATKSAMEQANTTKAQIENAEKLIPELEELSRKTNRTESENNRLHFIITQLNKAMPNLALAIDNETGALNRQIPTIYATAEAYKRLAEIKGLESEVDAYTQEKVRLQSEAEEAYKRAYGKKILTAEDTERIKQGIQDSGMYFTTPGKKAPNVVDWESLDIYNEIALRMQQANRNIIDSEKKLQEIYSKQMELPEDVKKILEGDYSGNIEPPPLLSGDDEKKAADKAAAEAEKRRQQAIQQEFKDLKFAKDMEYITEETYYKKLAELRDKYYIDWSDEYRSITLEIKRYNDNLLKEQQDSAEKARKEALQAQKDAFQERRKFSDEWIADQKFYNKLTVDEEIAAYERIRDYVKEYYKESIIDEKEYRNQIRNIDREIYAARKKAIEDEVRLNIDARKKILDAQKKAIQEEADAEKKLFDQRRKAIEDYYDEIDRSARQAERSTKLSELYEMEKLYQNAVTVEGKDRLREIRDEIRRLNQEAEKEQRDLEKNAKLEALEKEREIAEEKRKQRLEAISREYENLDSQQQALLENIANYAALTAGTLEQVTDKIKNMLDALNRYSNSLSGFENTGSGVKSSTTYNLYQTNNNNITDAVSANIFGSYITSGTMRFLQGVGR